MNSEKEDHEIWISVGDEQKRIDDATDQRIWSGIENKINKKRSAKKMYWAAAVLIPFLTMLFFYSSTQKKKSEAASEYVFETFEKSKTFTLPDGSIIQLKPNSKLTLNKKFGARNREVIFTGQGNFKITKDKTKPFRINAGDFHVQVLGTQFFLDQRSPEKKVELFEGKVKIENKKSITYLLPKEIWTNDKQNREHHYFNKEKEKHFAFNNENYSEAIKELEETYNIKIKYPGQFQNKKVSGSFTGNLNEVLSVISFPFHLKPDIINEEQIELK